MTDPAYLALADQLAAAAADAERTLRAAAADQPQATLATIPGPPQWVLPFLARHNQLVMQPHPQCIHLGPGPTVTHTAIWAPGFVCCTPCADAGLLAAQVPDGEEWRCDICGNDAAEGDLLGGRLRGGHIVIHFFLCGACNQANPAGA